MEVSKMFFMKSRKKSQPNERLLKSTKQQTNKTGIISNPLSKKLETFEESKSNPVYWVK